jgi:hypothetical protein
MAAAAIKGGLFVVQRQYGVIFGYGRMALDTDRCYLC